MKKAVIHPMSDREVRNAALSREAAANGMVLLENRNGTLPLKKGTKEVALFGCGAVRTARGGTGSGDPFNGGLSGGGAVDVNQSPRYHINIMDSFLSAGFSVVTENLLNTYAAGYDAQAARTAHNPMLTFVYPEMSYTGEQVAAFTQKTDTAIYVLSRNTGEGKDRSMKMTITVDGVDHEAGDYKLSEAEQENLRIIAKAFSNTVLVLNVGGVVDMDFLKEIPGIGAVLLMSQAGQEGGDALVDVLTGKVTPGGKLTATWANKYSDYPASKTFAYNDNNVDVEKYEEGIYVGYRYFDTFGIEPHYEFGYGLSYTDFSIECMGAETEGEWLKLQVRVKNTGSAYSGKEVVQVYYSAPGGWNHAEGVEKPFQELASFAKTKELKPGESQTLSIRFRIRDMASYDEAGACYKLDAGDYRVRVGDSSRNTTPAVLLKLKNARVTEQLHNEYPVSQELHEISKAGAISFIPEEDWSGESVRIIELDGSSISTLYKASPFENEEITTYTTDPGYKAQMPYEKVKLFSKKPVSLRDVFEGKDLIESFVAQMKVNELASLNCGTGWGVANEQSPIVGSNSSTIAGAAGETTPDFLEKYGIPQIVLADGPAGIRVNQEFQATNIETGEKVTRYQYCTAWPVGTLLAQSFDTELLFRVGGAMAQEAEELGITLILGPGINIHRDPWNGRNFEYFSEDPLLTGVMAAAIIKGIQSRPGTGACIKHFAANNQESNRCSVDTIVSERTLREIYLKGFEIAVRTAQPMSIMTSYNLINGIPTADSYDLNTDIARGEWGFKGLIMTDWNGGQSTPSASMHAGNDLIMPGGEQRILDIEMGVHVVPPAFDEMGQILLKHAHPFLPIQKAMWNSFTPGPEGKDTVTAELAAGYLAEEKEGRILVNGQPIVWDCITDIHDIMNIRSEFPEVHSDIAVVAENGRRIVYKGGMKKHVSICLGDIQRCAVNNLHIIMNSIGMQKAYPDIRLKPYSEIYPLEEWV